MVKIGFAKDVEKRITQMNSHTEVPYSFELFAKFPTCKKDADKQIHNIIDLLNPNLRTVENKNGTVRKREFFSMTPENAEKIIRYIIESKMIDGICEDVVLDKKSNVCEDILNECIMLNKEYESSYKSLFGMN